MTAGVPLLIPMQVCPLAPPGVQLYVDQITGYVLFGVIALMLISVLVAIGAFVVGKSFGIPRATHVGVGGVVVAVLGAICYQVAPGIVSGILGSGCVG